MRVWRLFLGMQRTNEYRPNYVIASWAYPTGYWRWALYWTPPQSLRDAIRWPRVGPCKNQGREWFGYWGITSFSGWADLPLIGGISLSTQPPMESMKARRAS